MARSQGLTDATAAKAARRSALSASGATEDDAGRLALAAGVGRRFVIDLEAGKPTAHLGKALAVATEVGLRPLDLMAENRDDNALLPDLFDEEPSRG
jgi:hypothetical protein